MLTRPVDDFILGEHARDLIASADGAAALPGRVPYGALVRAPAALRPLVAASIARSIAQSRPREWSADGTVLVAYHAIQWPVAQRLMDRGFASELWYSRWDRYEAAHDAGADRHRLLAAWHAAMAERSSLTFAVSDALAELDRAAGRAAITTPTSADAFPDGPLTPGGRGAELIASALADRAGAADASAVGADPAAGAGDADPAASGGANAAWPPPASAPVAVSLGHLGRRTDWAWLRAAAEEVPELRLLLVGSWHEDEVGGDADYQWLRAAPQAVWLGRLSDADAAAVIAEADAGLVPFTVDEFNDYGLPNRILKYARLGRPSISPTLAGCATWERAVTWADGPAGLVAALHAARGRRTAPDEALRAWAHEQTAAKMNAPLLARLGE